MFSLPSGRSIRGTHTGGYHGNGCSPPAVRPWASVSSARTLKHAAVPTFETRGTDSPQTPLALKPTFHREKLNKSHHRGRCAVAAGSIWCRCDILVFCGCYMSCWLFGVLWICLADFLVFCGCYMSLWHAGILWMLYVWHFGVLWMLYVFVTCWCFVDIICLTFWCFVDVLLTFCVLWILCLSDILVFCGYVFLTFWCFVDIACLSDTLMFCGCYIYICLSAISTGTKYIFSQGH